ncbi:MAG: flavodoxin-dependent (E)-4-hydroxy-3-methylbut-2-enyl-diphosphate synthase [Planctomycetes bacterium]|nr:flavodoxin-dependent (E)-4-hydroxy-3-methylbut-2-enyl-diphosphate synthase [Planctomycetota bacterium]
MAIPNRRKTRTVNVGPVSLGGEHPIVVQTMTKAKPEDIAGNLRQIEEAVEHGCRIVRSAIPSVKHLDSFAELVRKSPVPVVGDIHFDYRIAIGALKAGAAKIRINPGNMGEWDRINEIIDVAKEREAAIRIGVNSGSIKHKNADDERDIATALVEEALEYVGRFEERGFSNIVLSLKSPEPSDTVSINRLVAGKCDYPLHIGLTHAGREEDAYLKSAITLGALIMDGIGDTIRLSFTGAPVREVIAGMSILRAAGIIHDRIELISCPTCGRCSIDLKALANKVWERIKDVKAPLKVAVMGCEVNGPGEAKEADIGIAAAGGRVSIFINGEKTDTVDEDTGLNILLNKIREMSGTDK